MALNDTKNLPIISNVVDCITQTSNDDNVLE